MATPPERCPAGHPLVRPRTDRDPPLWTSVVACDCALATSAGHAAPSHLAWTCQVCGVLVGPDGCDGTMRPWGA